MANSASLLEMLAALAPLVVLALVAGFIGLIIWSTVRARRKAAERAAELAGMGFKQAIGAAPELEERVRGLRPRGGKRWLQLSRIFYRPVPGGTVYLYDMQEGGGDDASMQREVLGVVAPGLRLPHFSLSAKPEGLEAMSAELSKAEVVGRIVLRTVDWAVARAGFERVEYPDDPEFAGRFLVLAADPQKVDEFLTPDRRRELCALRRGLSVMGRGDFFVLEDAPGTQRGRANQVTALERLAEANRVLRILG